MISARAGARAANSLHRDHYDVRRNILRRNVYALSVVLRASLQDGLISLSRRGSKVDRKEGGVSRERSIGG